MNSPTIKLGARVITAAILIFGAAYALFQISKARSFQFFGGLTDRVNTEDKVVALTFDDAPTPHTGEVLNVLREKGIKATFYVIGENMEQYPEHAKALADSGMEIGNHSYSHDRFLLKSQAFIDREIQKTNGLIRATGYGSEITFRPPNGKKLFGLPWYLKKHDMQTIMWDIEPDTFYSDKDTIVEYALTQTKPGSIILMHPFCESCSADREALPVIIDRLKAQGFRFVTIAELLTYKK